MAFENKSQSKYKASEDQKAQFEEELADLEGRISRLRVLYDQYFMGIEKLEPMHLRKEIDKTFKRSIIARRGTTVQKFRYRGLLQRFTSYCSYWDRIVRLIEEGKIRRGVVDLATPGGNLPKWRDGQQRFPTKEAIASKRRRFKRAETSFMRQKEGAGAPQRTEFTVDEVALLHARLVEEKKRVGEPVDKITLEAVERSIRKTIEKAGGKELRFRVVEKDGKVSLSAVVKKG